MPLAPGDWLDDGRLRLDAPLGEGAFGTVWQATEHLGFGPEGAPIPLREVAVKCLPPLTDETEAARVIEEARALAEVNHLSVLRLFNAFADETGTYLVTEWATEGDLRSYFDFSIPTESELREVAVAVAHGLSYLHARGFVHGDLKPENVLVTETGDDDVRFMLGDFGLRAIIGHRNFQGTVPFIPPEAYGEARGSLTDRADIYALGLLLFEVATGYRLSDEFSDETLKALRTHQAEPELVRDAHRQIVQIITGTEWAGLNLPPYFGTLLRICTAFEPGKRPSAWGFMELWAAFERSQRGILIPYQIDRRSDLSRYQILFSRTVEIDAPSDATPGDDRLVAQLADKVGIVGIDGTGQLLAEPGNSHSEG